jgi:hypothetical protein
MFEPCRWRRYLPPICFLTSITLHGVTTRNVTISKLTFHVLTTMRLKMAVFCHVAPCSLVEINRRFRGTYCLRLKVELLGVIFTAVRASGLRCIHLLCFFPHLYTSIQRITCFCVVIAASLGRFPSFFLSDYFP